MEILETKIYLGLGGSPNPCSTPFIYYFFIYEYDALLEISLLVF